MKKKIDAWLEDLRNDGVPIPPEGNDPSVGEPILVLFSLQFVPVCGASGYQITNNNNNYNI